VAEQGRYLYAVCRRLDLTDLSGLEGLDGQPLAVVESEDGSLVALVSSVDLDEFGEEALRRNLERLDWLEKVARGHDTVVRAAAEAAPTAPTRLATIFRDDDGVRRRLAEEGDRIRAVLDRVEGHEEWAVKVLTRIPDGPTDEESPASSGTDYLRRRKEAQVSHESRTQDAQAMAEQVHDALVKLSAASRRLPAQDPRLAGYRGAMVHNAAYLVSAGLADDFAAAVGELAEEHRDVVIDVGGPWPAYSFAILDSP
jgi:hypothetical protein